MANFACDLLDEILDLDNREADYERATRSERYALLQEHYVEKHQEIMHQASLDAGVWAIEPYIFDWHFNPNEQGVWGSIRRNPMVMYPEFPVAGCFVDFGNPFLRIALEADGESYHDRERDTARDQKLLGIDWKVFRVSYRETISPFVPLGDIAEMLRFGREEEASAAMNHWLLHTADGVVDAICFFYFMPAGQRLARIEKYPEYLPLAIRTLKAHRLLEFPLPSV
jgi:very-short-patch-repair endonuclease